MATSVPPSLIPTTYPVELEVKFKFLVSNPEDYTYLLATDMDCTIAADAAEIFEKHLDLNCIEVNGVKTTCRIILN